MAGKNKKKEDIWTTEEYQKDQNIMIYEYDSGILSLCKW
jgi:hypothetical protein